MGRETRFGPFTTTDVPLMFGHPSLSFTCCFADVRVPRVILAIAVQLIDDLSRRKLSFVPPTNDVLKAGAGREDAREAGYFENASEFRGQFRNI